MAEYISREALLDRIKPDAREDMYMAVLVSDAKEMIRKFVSEAIAEDVVPVVRCKDCASREYSYLTERIWCGKICRYMPGDGYCSIGERKTDGRGAVLLLQPRRSDDQLPPKGGSYNG